MNQCSWWRIYQLQCVCIYIVNVLYTLSQCLAIGMKQSQRNLTRLEVVGCGGNIENQQSHIDLEQEFVGLGLGVDRNH